MKVCSAGIDIGGTKCAVSVGCCSANEIEIFERIEFPAAGKNWRETFGICSSVLKTLTPRYNIADIGISCGGPLDSDAGAILSPPNLPGWNDVPAVKYFQEKFGVPVHLQNDANACALAEYRFGAGRGTKNMVFLTFGTGLGAGLILDGRLYSGTNGNAGEIGHIRLAPDGPAGYNKAGSAEGFCSGGGIARLAEIMADSGKYKSSNAPAVVSARNGKLTAADIFTGIRNNDVFCKEVFMECAEKLGLVLSYIIDILNPEVIVLGGVFMRNAELFMKAVDPILEREALNSARKVCRIAAAEAGESIGDYAALAVACIR